LQFEDDAETVAELLYEAFVPFKREYTPGAFEYTTAMPPSFEADSSRAQYGFAMDEGEAVGTVSGLPEPDGST